jgi:hypothetical protein
MMARPFGWWKQKYAIPRGEEVKLQACSKEDGPVDFIITARLTGYDEHIYRLYKVQGTHSASGAKTVTYTGKQSKDPRVLEEIIFGRKYE